MNFHMMTSQSAFEKKEFNPLYILIFKTNITSENDLQNLSSVLNGHSSVLKWNVDTDDTDKVLRIESIENNTEEIIGLLLQSGFYCEELND
ncbi:MAG: hypothetical protein ABI772_08325 [Bacteroidota bacterium]